MNIDKAIHCLYLVVGEHRHSRNYFDALKALTCIEEAAEALNRSQQVLKMEMIGEFDKRLHGVMLHSAIVNNTKVLETA